MVPTVRPSGKTSILAPTRCGVEPLADTMVTSAASSPRSSACVSASKTSWDMYGDYRAGAGALVLTGYVSTGYQHRNRYRIPATGNRQPSNRWNRLPLEPVDLAELMRLRAAEKCLAEHPQTSGQWPWRRCRDRCRRN